MAENGQRAKRAEQKNAARDRRRKSNGRKRAVSEAGRENQKTVLTLNTMQYIVLCNRR